MPNPRYKAFVEVAGEGRPNHEYLDFIAQMRRLYAAQEGGSLIIEDQDAFTAFIQIYAMLYVPAAVPLPQVSGSLIERTEP